jgi:formylglycine-generating enzyme required for sulfatase activity
MGLSPSRELGTGWGWLGQPSAHAATAQECRKRGCRLETINTYKCVCPRRRPRRRYRRYRRRRRPQRRNRNPAGIKWVKIPGGTFQMGSRSGDKDEKPVHRVRVKTFWMAKTEVTVAQYRRCVRAGRCSKPDTGKQCNWGKGGRGQHPVNCVDWKQARSFSRWAGSRLPSEAQWEYAARSGGKSWKYPWGNAKATCARAVLDDRTHTAGCGKKRTWPVCSKPRGNSLQGLCDLAGNVSEWVRDSIYPLGLGSYRGAPTDGSAWVSGSSSNRLSRVLRGGSWNHSARHVRAAVRGRSYPSLRYLYLGFRPARSSPP